MDRLRNRMTSTSPSTAAAPDSTSSPSNTIPQEAQLVHQAPDHTYGQVEEQDQPVSPRVPPSIIDRGSEAEWEGHQLSPVMCVAE